MVIHFRCKTNSSTATWCRRKSTIRYKISRSAAQHTSARKLLETRSERRNCVEKMKTLSLLSHAPTPRTCRGLQTTNPLCRTPGFHHTNLRTKLLTKHHISLPIRPNNLSSNNTYTNPSNSLPYRLKPPRTSPSTLALVRIQPSSNSRRQQRNNRNSQFKPSHPRRLEPIHVSHLYLCKNVMDGKSSTCVQTFLRCSTISPRHLVVGLVSMSAGPPVCEWMFRMRSQDCSLWSSQILPRMKYSCTPRTIISKQSDLSLLDTRHVHYCLLSTLHFIGSLIPWCFGV